MTFVLVAVMAAAPVDVWLDVGSDAPCVTAPALAAALSARGHRVVSTPGAGLDVQLRGAPAQLRFRASRGARRFERTVPVTAGDCEAVLRVAVALLSSWAAAAPLPTATPASSKDPRTRNDGSAMAEAVRTASVNEPTPITETASSSSTTQPQTPRGAATRATTATEASAGAPPPTSSPPGTTTSTATPTSAATKQPARETTSAAPTTTNATTEPRTRTGAATRSTTPTVAPADASATLGTDATTTSARAGTSRSLTEPTSRPTASARSGAEASSPPTETTRTSSEKTSPASEPTRRNAQTTSAGAELVRSDAQPTPDEAATARNDAQPTPDEAATARSDSEPPNTARLSDDVTATTPAALTSPWSLEVIALAGIAHEPLPTAAPATTAQGHFGVRGALGRWGLLLDGGFESGRTRTVGVASATASSQWLSLCFSVGFRPATRFSLDLALGLRGWRFGASATGVADPSSQTFFTLGGVLSAGFNLQLVGPLHLQLRPWVSLRGSRAAFTVTNLGTVISVEPLAFGALLGALLRFE